jgi:hypothetical protein
MESSTRGPKRRSPLRSCDTCGGEERPGAPFSEFTIAHHNCKMHPHLAAAEQHFVSRQPLRKQLDGESDGGGDEASWSFGDGGDGGRGNSDSDPLSSSDDGDDDRCDRRNGKNSSSSSSDSSDSDFAPSESGGSDDSDASTVLEDENGGLLHRQHNHVIRPAPLSFLDALTANLYKKDPRRLHGMTPDEMKLLTGISVQMCATIGNELGEARSNQAMDLLNSGVSIGRIGYDDGKKRTVKLNQVQRFIDKKYEPGIRFTSERVSYKGREYAFEVANMWDVTDKWVREMLANPDDFNLEGVDPDPTDSTIGGVRESSDFRRFEKKACFDQHGQRLPNTFLVALQLFADGFDTCSRKNSGKASVVRINMSGFRDEVYEDKWEQLALIHKYNDVAYHALQPREKVELYHTILAKIFSHPVFNTDNDTEAASDSDDDDDDDDDTSDSGADAPRNRSKGIEFYESGSDEVAIHLHFAVSHVIADMLEQFTLGARKAFFRSNQSRCTTTCTCSGSDCVNLSAQCKPVTVRFVKGLETASDFKATSFHPDIVNAFWKVRFLNSKLGIYGALSFDPLHTIYLGLMKRVFQAWMRFFEKDEVAYLSANAELLASRLSSRQSSREWERTKAAMASKLNSKGEISKMCANEIPNVLMLGLLAVGNLNVFFGKFEIEEESDRGRLLRQAFLLYSESFIFLKTLHRFTSNKRIAKAVDKSYINRGLLSVLKLGALQDVHSKHFETTKTHAVSDATERLSLKGAGIGTSERNEGLMKEFMNLAQRVLKTAGPEWLVSLIRRQQLMRVIDTESEALRLKRPSEKKKREKLRKRKVQESKSDYFPRLSGLSIVICVELQVKKGATTEPKAKKKKKGADEEPQKTRIFSHEIEIAPENVDKTVGESRYDPFRKSVEQFFDSNSIVYQRAREVLYEYSFYDVHGIDVNALDELEDDARFSVELEFRTCMHFGNANEQVIFRSDPSYKKKKWYDFANVLWEEADGDKDEVLLPARIEFLVQPLSEDLVTHVFAVVAPLAAADREGWNDPLELNGGLIVEHNMEAALQTVYVENFGGVDGAANPSRATTVAFPAVDEPSKYILVKSQADWEKHVLGKYAEGGDRARDFDEDWGELHFKRSYPYVVDDRVKVAYYLKNKGNNPKQISQSKPWRKWKEDEEADGWIKGYITWVDYFDGVHVAFDKPVKKKNKKNKKQPSTSQLTFEDQYISWDILRTTRKNPILRRLRQMDDGEEETESDWEMEDEGEQENDEEEDQNVDGDYALDEDGNIQYF